MNRSFIEKTPGLAWWEYVSGPSLFFSKITEAIREGKSLCLSAPEGLPWRYSFDGRLADALREAASSLIILELTASSEDPGRTLVKHFDLANAYRASKTPVAFLKDQRALRDRVIRVSVKPEFLNKWLELVRTYRSSSIRDGIFILETTKPLLSQQSKYLDILNYNSFVSEYDTLVLAGLLLPTNLAGTEQKRYATTVAVSLLGIDAERIADFISTYRLDDDVSELFVQQGMSREDCLRRLWNAQVQTLFPLIMKEMWQFITTWYSRLVDAIDYANASFPNGFLGSNGKIIEKPEDMDIGEIRYLMGRRRRNPIDGSDTEDYILYIPDEEARERLLLLYTMRNLIAHHEVCSIDQVKQLLQKW